MIKAHISNDCEPEVKSFSLPDGGMFILQGFTPSPRVRKKSFPAGCIYIETTCVQAGSPRLRREDAASLPTVCLINHAASRKRRRSCEGKAPSPVRAERPKGAEPKGAEPKGGGAMGAGAVGAGRRCPWVLSGSVPLGDLSPGLMGPRKTPRSLQGSPRGKRAKQEPAGLWAEPWVPLWLRAPSCTTAAITALPAPLCLSAGCLRTLSLGMLI